MDLTLPVGIAGDSHQGSLGAEGGNAALRIPFLFLADEICPGLLQKEQREKRKKDNLVLFLEMA